MDKTASARIAYVNIFARDIVALSGFYARLFGFAEIEAHRSPIYRCLDAGGVELGFNAPEAYGLLGIADRKSRPMSRSRLRHARRWRPLSWRPAQPAGA